MNPATARSHRIQKRPTLPDAALVLATIDFEPGPVGPIFVSDEGLRRRWERIVGGSAGGRA